jgi:polysaccharide deacetylase 2 family uncharacterized protein YibQ
MARTPRKPATARKAARAGKAAGGLRGVSALTVVIFLLVAGAGAGIAWLSLTYEPPALPGMPGNDLVLPLDSDDTTLTTPPRETAQAPDSQADATPPDAVPGTEQGHGEQAAKPADAGDDAKPADSQTAATDQAPATPDQATTTPDQAGQDPGDKPADTAAAPENVDHGAPAAPAAPDTTTPQQQAAVPPGTDEKTAAPPAPAGLPQREPVGDKTAMQLKVPPPSPGVKPRIAVVLTGLGLSNAQTTAAVQALPANVTFAFSPYGNDLQAWADQARAAGHEVLLELPMEPLNFPNDDPGPHTLLTSLPASENVERMTWVLDRFTGYVGVTSQLGGRFTTQPEALKPILVELKKRGLLFLDTRASPDTVAPELAADAGLAHASNDVFLNEPTAARATLQAGLAELERLARERGSAIGIGYAYPVTMELLTGWARALEERGIELLPVSALARLPEAR